MTNNSQRTRLDSVRKLKGFGIEVTESNLCNFYQQAEKVNEEFIKNQLDHTLFFLPRRVFPFSKVETKETALCLQLSAFSIKLSMQ